MEFNDLLEDRCNRISEGLCPIHKVEVQPLDVGLDFPQLSHFACPHSLCDVQMRVNAFGLWEILPEWRYLLDAISLFSVGSPYKIKSVYPASDNKSGYAWLIQLQGQYHLIAHVMKVCEGLLYPTFGSLDSASHNYSHPLLLRRWSVPFRISEDCIESRSDKILKELRDSDAIISEGDLYYDNLGCEGEPRIERRLIDLGDLGEVRAVNDICHQIVEVIQAYVRSLHVPSVFYNYINTIKEM